MATEATKKSPATQEKPKRSAIEEIKDSSLQLRGSIHEELGKDSDHFTEQDKQLLKFHGSYQQEDRDARKKRKKEGLGKYYMFMVRCKIPGGVVSADQYLALDKLCEEYANNTLRITSRQGIQFHGILKGDLKNAIAGINDCLLTTLGACGDVNRNVMVDPCPRYDNGVHAQLQETGKILAAHFAPRSQAYHEIWLNGEQVHKTVSPSDYEPIYGKVYLPRKFKLGISLPENNLIDIYSQDLGLLAIVENDEIVGYNILVGGGMGMTHGKKETFPHMSKPICYVPAKAVVNAAEAVIKLFRDHGNRENRKRARIKYVVHDWGVDKFRQVLSEYIGAPLFEPKPVEVTGFDLGLGWNPQGNGKYWYGVSVENGRIKDEGSLKLRTALRKIITKYNPEVRFTPVQDVLLCDLEEKAKSDIESILTKHGVPLPEKVSLLRQHSMACPAIPTCGLAISESERALPGLVDELETELQKLGLENEKISIRMTGCPNGCVRPYQSDIGLVGRSGEKYSLFLGGNVPGTALNLLIQDLVPKGELVPTIVPILKQFKKDRQKNESFGNYCQRVGREKLHSMIPEVLRKPLPDPHFPPEAAQITFIPRDTVLSGDRNGEVAHPQPSRLPTDTGTKSPQEPVTESETMFAGPEEQEFKTHHFLHSRNGTVKETQFFDYGDDLSNGRIAENEPLRRIRVYAGKVDPGDEDKARKLKEMFFCGEAGEELRDYCSHFTAKGKITKTTVFFYEDDKRAEDAGSGAAIRREVVYKGEYNRQ